MGNPKLTIELVPQTCWFSNVRSFVKRSQWDKIRKRAYALAGYRCEVCTGTGRRHPVECHEVWKYDDGAGTQTLVRMIALCPACHEVKHIGRAHAIGRGEQAREHLAFVNEWDQGTADRYVDEQFKVWERRSSRSWKLDVAHLSEYGINVDEVIKAKDRPFDEEKARAMMGFEEPKEDMDHWWKHKKRTLERRKKKAAAKQDQ